MKVYLVLLLLLSASSSFACNYGYSGPFCNVTVWNYNPGYGIVSPLSSNVNYITRSNNCPLTWPSDGSLCCARTANLYQTSVDTIRRKYVRDLFLSWAGDSERQRRRTVAASVTSPFFIFDRSGVLEITMVADDAADRNQFGLYLIDQNNLMIPNSYVNKCYLF